MEYARLGQSDLSVSQVGFGCAAIGGYDYGRADDSGLRPGPGELPFRKRPLSSRLTLIPDPFSYHV